MSYICAYCDDSFSDNVMCPECVEHDAVTQRGLRDDLAAVKLKLDKAMEVLELAEEALTQAYVDEANCDGLHVAKGHHGPRAKNDCFELWASVPAHQEALNKVRAILEPEKPNG